MGEGRGGGGREGGRGGTSTRVKGRWGGGEGG